MAQTVAKSELTSLSSVLKTNTRRKSGLEILACEQFVHAKPMCL
jgi:hypothetical protein